MKLDSLSHTFVALLLPILKGSTKDSQERSSAGEKRVKKSCGFGWRDVGDRIRGQDGAIIVNCNLIKCMLSTVDWWIVAI